MAIQNTINNTLQPQKRTFSAYINNDAVKNKINQILQGKDGVRFITSLISTVSNNPNIAECDHGTILSAALLGESLKLSPSPQLGQFYIVPFNDTNNNRKVATFQLGYKGYIQLAMRSGQYRDLDVIEIRDGEYKGKDAFTGKPKIEFIEDDNTRLKLPIIGYFAYFELLNGFRKSLFWSKEKMQEHALNYSQAYKKDIKKGWKMSFWSKDFDAMAFKTMLRQLISKWGVMSIDFQNAYINDTSFKEDINAQPNYIDNISDDEIETIEPQIKEEIAQPEAQETQQKEIKDPLRDFD